MKCELLLLGLACCFRRACCTCIEKVFFDLQLVQLLCTHVCLKPCMVFALSLQVILLLSL